MPPADCDGQPVRQFLRLWYVVFVWPNMSHKQAQHGLSWWETQALCLNDTAALLTYRPEATLHATTKKRSSRAILIRFISGSAHLGLFRSEKQAHLQMCLNPCMLQRGLRPRLHLLIGSPGRIDKEEFHSQNPNSPRGESLYHCVISTLAWPGNPLFISMSILLNPSPPARISARQPWIQTKSNRRYMSIS